VIANDAVHNRHQDVEREEFNGSNVPAFTAGSHLLQRLLAI